MRAAPEVRTSRQTSGRYPAPAGERQSGTLHIRLTAQGCHARAYRPDSTSLGPLLFALDTSRFFWLEPVVVEADADALGGHRIGRHLVTQPALEKHQRAFLGGNHNPRPIVGAGIGDARRRGHEAIESRVLELQSRTPLGGLDIVS